MCAHCACMSSGCQACVYPREAADSAGHMIITPGGHSGVSLALSHSTGSPTTYFYQPTGICAPNCQFSLQLCKEINNADISNIIPTNSISCRCTSRAATMERAAFLRPPLHLHTAHIGPFLPQLLKETRAVCWSHELQHCPPWEPGALQEVTEQF